MTKRFYLHIFALIALICYAGNLTANDYNLIPSTGRKVFVPLTATSAKGQLLITNYGRSTINNFEYTLSFEGKELAKKEYTLPTPLNRMEGATIEVDVPPHDRVSETSLQIAITKVNGEPNGATVNFASLPRLTVTKVPHRRVVVEDFTGMWCPYCTRGLALMENLANTYGDDFVGITIHTSDALHCWDYAGRANENRSRPWIMMNRNLLLGYEKATNEFDQEKAAGAEMDIEVTAVWDDQKENITVTPRVTFCVDREEAPYGFAYVLTEDGKASQSWVQVNAYTQQEAYRGVSKELDFFIDSPYAIRGLVNNFVAIAAEGVKYPLKGYLKTPVVADKTQSHEYVFTNISSKRLIQDKSKLSVCVLLINLKTGQIENAAKCRISEPKITGVAPLQQEQGSTVEIARYTLDGRRISTPQIGVNLVKYSDGSVRKEMIRK